MVGARMREHYDEQAKERQKAVGGTGKKAVPVSLPEAVRSDARDAVAKVVGVSGKSIDRATKILKHAIPKPELDAAPQINHIYRVGTCQPGLITRTTISVS